MKPTPSVAFPATILVLACLWAAKRAEAGFGFCTLFSRADTNADGTVDISDGIATLRFLFLGGGPPSCLDAADADDSGEIDLSDAVFTFNYLFLGGRVPPSPGPSSCGLDETPDDALLCDDYPPCAPTAGERDLRGFGTFAYRIEPALGFCVALGEVYAAEIVRQADGVYRLSLSVLIEGDSLDPRCVVPLSEGSCLLPEAEEPRALEAGEVADMLAAFSALQVFDEQDPICACVAIDPCRIEVFRWDGFQASGFECSAPRLPRDHVEALQELLASFRSGG